MSQNRSTAVMQRRIEAHDSLDDFPTPPWATRALCERLRYLRLWEMTAREPAANRGHMVKPLRQYFGSVEASDIFDYGAGFQQADYLFGPPPNPVHWTITNPPFRLAEQFIQRMIETSTVGCAIIVRSAFLEGVGRYQNLFSKTPPALVMQFVERAPMVKGRLDKDAASATAYSWLVWNAGHKGNTTLEWIAPCRKQLEMTGDYA